MTVRSLSNSRSGGAPESPAEAAVRWLEWGLRPIPIAAGTVPADWDLWLALTPASLRWAWKVEPGHLVGAILDDSILVLAACSPQARTALHTIERAFGKESNQIHTAPGREYHFFRRRPGTRAVMESHSPATHPHRINIRTGRSATEGRSIVVLPPSAGYSVYLAQATCVADLVEADQAFIDAVALNNGSHKPRARLLRPERYPHTIHPGLASLLRYVDPHPVEKLPAVFRNVHAISGGSAAGLRIAQLWAASLNIGDERIEYLWRSLTCPTA